MQDMKNEQAQLQEKLYKKMQQEQNEYLEGIKKLPSEEILTKAYAISCRENFLYIVQEDDPLSLEQLQVLLELPHPLAKLYECCIQSGCIRIRFTSRQHPEYPSGYFRTKSGRKIPQSKYTSVSKELLASVCLWRAN